MADLHDLTALEQAAAMHARDLDPMELVEHYLRRIERLDRVVGAYVTVTADRALDMARDARDAILAADDPADLPVLLGVPIPAKDLNLQAGVPCRFGSAVVEVVPADDDDVVAAMRAGGLVLPGKTNTPEFGLPCYTEPEVAPPARTPWDLDRSAGGSSGGAAAAVASGLAAAAQGSDGGGSIRIPASTCGLVGLKPSRGRVSNGPDGDSVGDLPVGGPIARTVADAAALLDVLAVRVPGAALRADALPPGETFLAAVAREPGRLRIGRHAEPLFPGATVAPQCVAALDDATDLLVGLGHEVVATAPPFGADLVPRFEQVWSVLSLLAVIPPADEPRLRPLTRWLRERGRAVSGADLAMAVGTMRTASRRAIDATADLDAVLTPTLAQLPAAVGGLRDDDDPAADFLAQEHFTPFTSPYNVTGQPAITLPLHWTAEGLPVGVQLVGRPGGEAALLSLAAQLERARPWHDRRPALW